MESEVNGNSDGLVDAIQSLVENKELLQIKIFAANIVNQKMKEKLERLCMERKEETNKIKELNKQIAILEKAQYHAACHEYRVGADRKRKASVIGEFQKLVETETQFNIKAELEELERLKSDFVKLKESAPWLPEKHAIQRDLKRQQDDLARVQGELASIDQRINEREKKLEQHDQMSFQKFCITLANYVHKKNLMETLMKNELGVKKTLEGVEKEVEQQREAMSKSIMSAIEEREEEPVFEEEMNSRGTRVEQADALLNAEVGEKDSQHEPHRESSKSIISGISAVNVREEQVVEEVNPRGRGAEETDIVMNAEVGESDLRLDIFAASQLLRGDTTHADGENPLFCFSFSSPARNEVNNNELNLNNINNDTFSGFNFQF